MFESTLVGQEGAELSSRQGVRGRERGPEGLSLSPSVGQSWDYAVPRGLDACEIRRRLMHMLPGFFPFLLWAIPHPKPWGPILTNVVLLVMGSSVAIWMLRFQQFARAGETEGRASVLCYVFPVLLALTLFRGREEIGMMTLVILAFGDGSATLGGITLGGYRLPWNRGKTITGLICFLAIGGPLASLALWGESAGAIPLSSAFLCGLLTVLTAAIAESVPSRINDNLRVGLTSVLVGALLQVLLVG